ncbi:MAG: hypothetical protein KGN84_12615 [Acidobacteriota bacterium]|nr:hypothetical protein [Acidobacteriota bacterium]
MMNITAVVPMIPVRDVERSAVFYRILGFEVGNREPKDGQMGWAWLYSPDATDWRRGPNLMLIRNEHPVGHPARRPVYFFYASDLLATREALIRAGETPGPIRCPGYLPKGEFAIDDPDGHSLTVAQRFEATP